VLRGIFEFRRYEVAGGYIKLNKELQILTLHQIFLGCSG
jgi:hypothetical protein